MSAPGGIIFLTRGIVDLAGNEDELAAILAHEIQHIVAKDPLKAIKSQRLKALGTFAAGEAMGSGNQVVRHLPGLRPGHQRHPAAEGLLARPGKERRPGRPGTAGRDRLRARGAAVHAGKSQGHREEEGQGVLGPPLRRQAHRLRVGVHRPERPPPSDGKARAARFRNALSSPLNLKRFWLSTALIFACTFALGSLALPSFREKDLRPEGPPVQPALPRPPVILVEIDQESIDFYSQNLPDSLALAAQPLRAGDRFPDRRRGQGRGHRHDLQRAQPLWRRGRVAGRGHEADRAGSSCRCFSWASEGRGRGPARDSPCRGAGLSARLPVREGKVLQPLPSLLRRACAAPATPRPRRTATASTAACSISSAAAGACIRPSRWPLALFADPAPVAGADPVRRATAG